MQFKYTVSVLLIFLLNINSTFASSCEGAVSCINNEELQVKLAIGLGGVTNPLKEGDNIPLVILPDVAWYGDNFYLDNLEMGFQWFESSEFAAETFVTVNPENMFFDFTDFKSTLVSTPLILAPPAVEAPGIMVDSSIEKAEELPTITVEEIADRDWAYDVGVRFHWRLPDSEWRLAVASDISDVYDGVKLSLDYTRYWQVSSWTLALSPKFIFVSDKLVDYYYGISERDTSNQDLFYAGKSGIKFDLGAFATRELSENWDLIINAGVTRLPDSIFDSPLVEKRFSYDLFFGAAYQF